MGRKNASGAKPWIDPDDAPELTAEHFVRAAIYEGERLIRRGRGRPKIEAPKQQITLRLDQDVIRGMRDTGPGWQARVNEALRRWLQRQRKGS